MKCILALSLVASTASGQTGTATVAGTLVDASSSKPVPAAMVLAIRTGTPPLIKKAKSGADGTFRIQGLEAGSYSLCVQAAGGAYLDPCHWNTSSPTVTVAAGQASAGHTLRLAPAAVIAIQVKDAQKAMSQTTKDGRRPDLTLGVWGPKGLYHPARLAARPIVGTSPQEAGNTYTYQVEVPRDTPLKMHVASKDLKLGDASGVALPGNASEQAFQQASGDPKAKGFAYTVLGALP